MSHERIGMCVACGMQTTETVIHSGFELCPSCREQCLCPICERNADIAESVRRSGYSTGGKNA